MKASDVINGTWGEVWIDGTKASDCRGLQAKIDLKKEVVNICGQLSDDSKIVGWTGKGSVKLHKMNTRLGQKLGDSIRAGTDLRFVIISKLSDPQVTGSERVSLKGVSFDDLTLADWEVSKNGEVEAPFTFTDFEYIDSITPV
jgi:hypothetical protein